MLYRLATLAEVDTLIDLRKKQLIDEGIAPNVDIDAELQEFFHRRLSDGSLIEWVAVDGEQIVATAAIIFYDFPPTYSNKSGVKGYVTNIYTKPAYRGQGLATALLDKVVAEAKARKVEKLWLGASKMGRPVYLKYGFKQSDEWLELNGL